MVFQLQQIGLFVFQQTAQRHAGPVGDHSRNSAHINVQRQQRRVALDLNEFLLQRDQMCRVGDILTRLDNQGGQPFFFFILLFECVLPNRQRGAALLNLR